MKKREKVGWGFSERHTGTWKWLVSQGWQAAVSFVSLSVLFIFYFQHFTSQNEKQIASEAFSFELLYSLKI